MKLLIDFGNSRYKSGYSNGSSIDNVITHSYSHSDVDLCIENILQKLDLKCVEHIYVVSVLGAQFDKAFSQALVNDSDIPITFYYSQKDKYGIQLSYADVSTYGADRYVALVAAQHKKDGNKIVIDCGTATTIDVLDGNSIHQGGLIMPGANLMLETLANRTTGIPSIDSQHTVNILNDNTQDSVYSGCISQLRFAVEGVVNHLAKQLFEQATQVTILLTGGESDLLDTSALTSENVECIHCPDLVLEGLLYMQK